MNANARATCIIHTLMMATDFFLFFLLNCCFWIVITVFFSKGWQQVSNWILEINIVLCNLEIEKKIPKERKCNWKDLSYHIPHKTQIDKFPLDLWEWQKETCKKQWKNALIFHLSNESRNVKTSSKLFPCLP